MWDMVKVAVPSLERAWMIIGAEFSPLWTAIYAGVAQQPASTQSLVYSTSSLRHWAIDLIDWPIDNGQRWDVSLQPFHVRDHDNERIIRQIRPPSERVTTHWNNDPYATNAGGGYEEYEPAIWRLPYFMMLFYKLI